MKKNEITFPRTGHAVALVFTLMIYLGVADSAYAQAWRIEPIISAGGEYDDNATLDIRTDTEVQLSGYLLEMKADLSYSSPATSFFLEPRFLLRRYPDESDFDSNDIFLRSNYRYRGTYNTFGFRLNFDRQSVRTGERQDSDLEIEDPEEIPENDTARLFRFGDRDSWWFSPYWGYQISNETSIGVDLDYVDTTYDEELAGFLDDFTDTRLNANLRRSFSRLTTGIITVTGRRYNAKDSIADIDGVGILFGVERVLTETSQVTAMVGLEDTDTVGPDTDPEVVGGVTYSRSLKTINMFAQYRRAVVASGARTLSLRDSVSFNFRRRLSEKISAGVGIRGYRSRSISATPSIDDRNYVQLQSAFTWYVAPYLAIEADYRYTVLDRSAALGERSNSNRVSLWFIYQPRTVPKI